MEGTGRRGPCGGCWRWQGGMEGTGRRGSRVERWGQVVRLVVEGEGEVLDPWE